MVAVVVSSIDDRDEVRLVLASEVRDRDPFLSNGGGERSRPARVGGHHNVHPRPCVLPQDRLPDSLGLRGIVDDGHDQNTFPRSLDWR